ncbi:MAG: hypothetical protein RR982_02015 [Kiritimatiellia bacterium]
MHSLRLILLLLFASLLSAEAPPSPTLAATGEKLTAAQHVYGKNLDATSLHGRVVIIWNATALIDPVYQEVVNGNASAKEAGSAIAKIKDEIKAFRAKVKGDLKSGKLLVIIADPLPSTPEQKSSRNEALRRINLPFSVYNFSSENLLFGADGKFLVTVGSLKDFTDGDRLTQALNEAPDYLPGRIILFRTKFHEPQSKRLVEGKNIEAVVAALRRETSGTDDKAEEAKQMMTSIETFIKQRSEQIDSLIASTPSQAINSILCFSKTVPSQARRYRNILNTLRKHREIKTLCESQDFLVAVANDKVGKNALCRGADRQLAALEPLTQSKNSAIQAEAQQLIETLRRYSSAVANDQKNEAREQRKAERNKNENPSEKQPSSSRVSAYSRIAPLTGSAADLLREELEKIDDETCNYDAVKVGLTKYETQKGPKSVAAKSVIDAIDTLRTACLEELTNIQKSHQSLSLFTAEWDTEARLTVNFPSLQTTPEGRYALKLLRNSEVKRFVSALAALTKTPPREEGVSNEQYNVICAQNLLVDLRALQKYSKTTSPVGKECVMQLETLGFSNAEIEKKLDALKIQLKELKVSMKNAEKANATRNN